MPNEPTAQEHERSSILDIVSYDLVVDLTGDAATFSSRTEIRFRCKRPGSTSFADLQAARVRQAVLNGANVEIGRTPHPSRLELPRLASENTLVVDAEFSYTSAEAGLHRVTGPEGGSCVYSKAYPGGAPRIFCCFDQADLRAPFTVAVKAPAGWSCLANGPVISRPGNGDAGWWKFAPTYPIAPLVASICAGPFSGLAFTCQRHTHLPLPVTVNALPSAAAHLESTVSPELIRQPLAYYEHGLGAAYPYGKCDFVFVPAFPKRAFGAPGLVTIRDTELAAHQADGTGLHLALVMAHELAHQWFGGIIDLCRNDDSWLIEPLTTYISRAELEEIHPGTTPWAPAVSQAMPDHAYAPDAAKIRQLEELIGRQAVLSGLREVLRRHAHGCATKDDLVHYWSRASGINLRSWATETLKPAATDKSDNAP
ncbi:MAG TPA: M1 family aminopeptidase [Streptosporangiaceae bacterium]